MTEATPGAGGSARRARSEGGSGKIRVVTLARGLSHYQIQTISLGAVRAKSVLLTASEWAGGLGEHSSRRLVVQIEFVTCRGVVES